MSDFATVSPRHRARRIADAVREEHTQEEVRRGLVEYANRLRFFAEVARFEAIVTVIQHRNRWYRRLWRWVTRQP